MERNLPVLAPLRHSREGMFILGLITFIAFLGLTNSWYLLTMGVSGDPLICNVLDGCNLVAESLWCDVLFSHACKRTRLFYYPSPCAEKSHLNNGCARLSCITMVCISPNLCD